MFYGGGGEGVSAAIFLRQEKAAGYFQFFGGNEWITESGSSAAPFAFHAHHSYVDL